MDACRASDRDRILLVKSVFFPEIQRLHNRFTDSGIVNSSLATTIAKFNFAPDAHPTARKPHLGLGPLAFVPRHPSEVARVRTLLDQTPFDAIQLYSRADMEDQMMLPPDPPDNIMALSGTLNLQAILLTYLFSDNCPLATQLHQLVAALENKYTILSENPQIAADTIIPHILQTVTVATQDFFNTNTNQTQLDNMAAMPRANLLSLIDDIRTTRLTMKIYPLYMRPQARQPTPQAKRPPSLAPATEPPAKRNSRQQQGRKDHINHDMPPALQKIFTDWQATTKSAAPPRITQIITALRLNDPKTAVQHFGLPANSCLRYALLGACRSQTCHNYHNPIPATHKDMAQAALQKACADIPASS